MNLTASLTVALVTDIHHGPDGTHVRGSAALPLLQWVLAELLGHHPALLVELGDRVNSADPEQARVELTEVAACFEGLELPRAHLLGNHDVTARAEQAALLGVPLGNRSLELQGWQLIFVDTFDGSVEGAMSDGTLEWLAQTLALSELPAVVFSHQPLDGQALPGNVFFGGAFVHQAHPRGHDAVRQLLERSGRVKLAVSGHAHWHHRVTVGGISYLTLDALVPLQGAPDEGVYGLLTLEADAAGNAARLETFGRRPVSWAFDL